MFPEISITVLGGGHEIGANSYLLRWGEQRILLDCGRHPRKKGYSSLPELHKIGDRLDAILITHAHMDHIGSLPVVMSKYPDTPVYCLEPTVDVIDLMTRDASKLMARTIARRDGDRLQTKEISQAWTRDYPRFGFEEFFHPTLVGNMVRRLQNNIVQPEVAFPLTPELSAVFYPTGHVLGSASIMIGTHGYRLLYTGDFTLQKQPVHMATQIPPKDVDTLIIESTYGKKTRRVAGDLATEKSRLLKFLNSILGKGESVLIPSFALGRAQDLLAVLQEFRNAETLSRRYPILMMGLGNRITTVYQRYQEKYLQVDIDGELTAGVQEPPYGMSWEDMLEKNAIILAGSGMLNKYTPAWFLANSIRKGQRHGIAFVGYTAPGTLSNDLANGPAGSSRIETFTFSAHAKLNDLVSYAEQTSPRNILVTHGDYDAEQDLAEQLHLDYFTQIPNMGETIFLHQTGMKSMEASHHIRARIITCGTTLIENCQTRMELEKMPTLKQLMTYLDMDNALQVSDELRILARDGLDRDDHYHFLVSATPAGILVGRAYEKYFSRDHLRVKVDAIPFLDKDHELYTQQGLRNLINRIADLLDEYRPDSVIYAVGGYKPMVYHAALAGQILQRQVKFMHDDWGKVQAYPQLPVDFDFMEFRIWEEQLSTILYSPEQQDVADAYEQLPAELRFLVAHDDALNQYVMSDLGELFFRAYRQQEKKLAAPVPLVFKGKNFWNIPGGKKTLDHIPDAGVRALLNRFIQLFFRQVRGFTLHDFQKKTRKTGTHMRLNHITTSRERSEIHYRLTTAYGSCQVIMDVFPGSEERIVAMTGKQIWE